jgi:uncharacterized protein DUF4154
VRAVTKGLVLTLAVFVFQVTPARARAAAQHGLEYDVKAAYLFNLANASEWPLRAFSSSSALFRVCVAEPNPFGAALTQTFRDERVGGHPVVVSPVRSPEDVLQCCSFLTVLTAAVRSSDSPHKLPS